ncbi:PfkB family carbohydrate kinase [Photobacterium sp. TY1-4]|uniref:PfkB family carbohydrate kinase n=1 Tax=Photobacterium sp. TY1-4 TaxID=2899122 RepID=UPI0021BE6055|nr:PfkB family carbohydrate kinase [Photobacterium sp. TY1-4]UXI04196.1 PfkB family carbohydrate kinase [Photobacterium sp. TY1-4]
MANIMLVANLNCDRVLTLDKPLSPGGRHHYQDGGRRLGGGGANTGLGLIWAGHQVALVSQVGKDDTADWLLAEASLQGLNCSLLHRHDVATPELLLVMTPDGERTIIRPHRPPFLLGNPPDFSRWDVLYFNSSAQGCEAWAQAAMPHCLVVAQLAKDERLRPCHVLITSKDDWQGRSDLSPWQYARQIAGESLQYFVMTDGANGAVAYSEEAEVVIPAVPAEVVDTTGAGDAFAAGLIHALISQSPIQTALEEGAKWAACAVSTSSSTPGEALKQQLSLSLSSGN